MIWRGEILGIESNSQLETRTWLLTYTLLLESKYHTDSLRNQWFRVLACGISDNLSIPFSPP